MYVGPSWANRTELTAVNVVPVETEKNELRVGAWSTEPEEDAGQQIPTFISLSEALAALSTPPKHTVITFSEGSFTEPSLLSVSQVLEIVGAGLNISDVHSTQLTTKGIVSKSSGKLTLQSLRLVPSSTSSVLTSAEDSGNLTRTSTAQTPVESMQCASCIEGKTSGTVKVLYCRFGACTTKGRAGAIDLEKNGENSAVEMSSCYFDQNSAGEGVPDAVRGDDVVLKSFDDSNTRLDLSTIKSFPSLQSILINSKHSIVPPPTLLIMSSASVSDYLTWSYYHIRLSASFLETYPLQSLLGSRLWNNTNTLIQTESFSYNETMTPLVSQNSTVRVNLYDYTKSIITVEQQNEVFITLTNATLSFTKVQFSLTTPTLTQTFIDSVGPYVHVEYQYFLQPIALDSTHFIRLICAEKDANLSFLYTTPLLAGHLTTPFIVCEGAKLLNLQTLRLNYSFVNSASFVSAKDSTLVITLNQVQLQSTANGAFLNLEDGSVRFKSDTCQSCSGVQGGLVHCRNSTVVAEEWTLRSCSATQGGVLMSVGSRVSIYSGSFSNCVADEGGVAYVVSSTLSFSKTSLVSNSAKRGGVLFLDFGTNSASSISSSLSNFTSNSACDVSENGVDSGKGGAIFMMGTTTSQTPLVLNYSRFDRNTAAFGNDVFVEETVLGETGPDLLSSCNGESYSRFPHLEIENHNRDANEIARISHFLPFPVIRVSSSGSDVPACQWSSVYCKTIQYALNFLQTTAPNGSLFQRQCFQYSNTMTTEPVVLCKHDLVYSSYNATSTEKFPLSLSVADRVVFTINDESRLTVVRMRFRLTSFQQVVTVNSNDGQVAMENCYVFSESGTTTSRSPIDSIGKSLVLTSISFAASLTSSQATLSVPLVRFAPKPSEEGRLGSGTFELTLSQFFNLTFEGTTMFEIETNGRVAFLPQSMTGVTTNSEQGKYISLKGQSFKQQIEPSLWQSTLYTMHLPYFLGEDVSMDENDKWRNNSLVYWLISPSSEIQVGSDVYAVDHPNCGSSTFKCSTLDSAITSAGLNSLSTLALSMSTSLSSRSLLTSSLLIKPSSSTKRGIEFDKNGSFVVANSEANLSFTSIIFALSQNCITATLFVVEEGELSFSLCQMGGTSNESPLVLPESTTTLIEVKAGGKFTLTDTLIQHIEFSHATLGTALRLHLDSTISFNETSKVGEILSNGTGSHVALVTSTGLDESSISSLTTNFSSWKPTTNEARFTSSEINEFVAIDEVGRVEAGETMLVCGSVTETTGFIATKNLSVKSSDSTTQILSIANSASFTTQASPLSFTDLIIIPLPQASTQNAEITPRTESLFIVKSGSLSLSSCSVSSFELSSSPLITHTSGTLTLKSCEISSITRSTGNGTVLSIEMGTGMSLLLDDIKFLSMPSSKEATLLALSFPPCDEDEPDPLFAFTLTNLTFNSMSGMASEPPCFISIVGTDLASWIEVADPRFKNSYNNDSVLDSYSSFDKSNDLAVSLLFYLRPSDGPVGVSSSGYAMAKCGSNSLWCSTIEQSLTRLTPQNTKKIIVMDEVTLSNAIALPDELTFAGNPSPLSTCIVSAAGSFVSEDIDFTTISKLTFSLPSTQTAEAVIVHSSITLTLSHLELTSTTESSVCFLKVTTGKVEMSDIKIRSEMAQNSILFSIFGGTVTASQFGVESGITQNGTVVQVEGGSMSLTGMTATSSKAMEGRLFSVSNALFNLSDVKLSKQTFANAPFHLSSFGASTISDMNISECSGSTIMTIKDGDELTIRNSIFSSLTPPTSLNEADTTDFSNSPSNLEWPSLRRNVKCTNGTVGMDTMNGGDGPSSPHLWIWTDECAVTKDDETQHSTLFVPTLLSNESTSILDKKLNEYSVKVVGTMMIPCGLKLEVFEQAVLSTSNEGQPLSFDISSLQPSKWTETELSFVLLQSSLADLNKKSDIRCRLVFGDGQNTDSFSLIGKGKGNMSLGGVVTTIVVQIVAVIIVAVLLIIVIAVLCRRKKTKNQAAEKDKQELDVAEAGDVLKDEGDAQDNTIKPIFGTAGRSNISLLMVSEDKQHGDHVHTLGTPSMMSLKHVEAPKCDGEAGVVSVDPTHTLYHRLHVEKARVVEKKKMALRIVTGLERMMADNPSSELLTKLSPHWIILDFNENTFLRIESISQLLASDGMHQLSTSTKNDEDRRWNAPEQDSKEGETANEQEEQYDHNKATVFRLGLVLWEMETGQVPFGELDAVNASRQVTAGILPLIHNWEDADFADLVSECLSLSPDSRPSLADVKIRLGELKTAVPPAAHDPPPPKEPAKVISGIETL
ncbi:hypothetical protein BLNAU_17382 [Blattamonas nauphoetae]|uniref:Protein kinase domain-containing protein n=1 Tax=Blattamonas nauphoetae TaxID=2049346 RepID=A0ABQ9XAM8_9EUKA|nr:hypothetical protein BLNAU_17382 [Blattamonas nauphoetae]